MSVGILGDPHLGRAFVRGVSLEKRGLREKMMLEDFQQRVKASGQYDVFICLGDLFDKWAVPYGIVFQAAWSYLAAARKNPTTDYFVIAGNHDISRDLEKKGALDLFELIVGDLSNVHVVRHHKGGFFCGIGRKRVGFFPFHPTKPAAELVTEKVDIAFGHWDTIFGDSNLIPTKKLAEMGCEVAYTGHVHLPDEFTRDDVKVVQVGSMQPYAHGEDNGEMYVTLALDELEGKDLRDKCIRVLLAPGERLDVEVDCLQLTVQRVGANEEETEEVTMGDFDLMALFGQAFEEAGVPTEVRGQILTRFEEARVAE
ncbi:metallophosphoesterase [Mesorhizobium sp. B2-4-5]|uniref:metallophosphoesterase n=1 Tax=Mesorhizobium sp. B2-4-5 TaxID=2589944 RepID=UPI0015E440F4|nr:metallophosphoesterase [Mesorhizobium sp. B2-4-5]